MIPIITDRVSICPTIGYILLIPCFILAGIHGIGQVRAIWAGDTTAGGIIPITIPTLDGVADTGMVIIRDIGMVIMPDAGIIISTVMTLTHIIMVRVNPEPVATVPVAEAKLAATMI
jgi:hypothetical protein